MTTVVTLTKELVIIYSKFKNLKLEKQKQIIDAALKEFAQNGFEKASTNEIVKNANISKGALFNYFNSKKDLYIYLFNYSIEIIENLYEEIDLNERDIFKRIGNIGLQKLQIQKEFSYAFDFLASLQLEESMEVKTIIGEKVAIIYDKGIKKMYKHIDYSKFRDDIEIEKAIEILNWTMFGFGEKVIKKIDTFKDSTEFGEKTLEEWERYADILKNNFYK
ncbi:TetR/AcrR family transcriptional regulator [Tissierella sp. MB52-C2]|uniref:TetR/AcrR family transcriptional regulator n=1 Tax=Tissierella sp. MB52-C2 TaxID=3070999 RepID=UPI00280B4B02|nr:TetR/AcrR family transcriptional regulator [Tissierella sp. MB52-C2]WMM26179.1 TetR/AcrR family transcriptional regulator [Tissierella sp. MB52-C2]